MVETVTFVSWGMGARSSGLSRVYTGVDVIRCREFIGGRLDDRVDDDYTMERLLQVTEESDAGHRSHPDARRAVAGLGRPTRSPNRGRGMKLGLHLATFQWQGGAPRFGRDAVRSRRGRRSRRLRRDRRRRPRLAAPDRRRPAGVTSSRRTRRSASSPPHTERVRLLTLATAASYRPPGLLAKMVTTLDVLSGGRAMLGIGAGDYAEEAAGSGCRSRRSASASSCWRRRSRPACGCGTASRATSGRSMAARPARARR